MHRTMFSLCLLVVFVQSAFATEPLPGTEPLEWTDLIDVRMMRDAHRFVELKIDESVSRLANRQPLSPSDLQAKRERLKFLVGAGGREREPHSHLAFPAHNSPVRMERISDDDLPAIVFEDDLIRISRVQWPVYDGVTGEGLLLEPVASTKAHVVVVPDADQSPEMLAGLVEGIPPENQIARRLAVSGASVIVPVLINRQEVSLTNSLGISNREWIYRQAFHMGRHVIGYEIDKIVAAVDWFEKMNDGNRPIGITGWGEGERLARYAMAIDTRIDAALLSGNHSENVEAWREPIYRNVWSISSEWNASVFQELVATRAAVLEESQDAVIDEKRDKANLAKGRESTNNVAYGETSINDFCSKIELRLRTSNVSLVAPRNDLAPFIAERHLRQLKQLDDYTQRLARESEAIRDAFYLNKALPKLAERRWSTESFHETTPVSEFTAHTDHYRSLFWNEVIGRFDDSLAAPNPRSRFIRDTESWAAHEVVLDVVPGLFAWGILLLPKDIKQGEKRPVVVVQHGRSGLPENILNGGYNGVAQKLTDHGYIVFAPHNLYRGEDEYRWLDRKANSIGKSLFSFLLLQHDQITRWLESLPQADGNRIAFYGNSYGGESAVRIPTILPRYALSICASDFNDWTRKVTDTHDKHSFMRTIEWEMPYFNMGNTFSYAEMAYLMIPRPFMVERGHHDLVAPDHWVASEYAKVRLVYDQLGIGDRTAITYFQGGHTMRGEETVEFTDRHFK